MWKNLQFFSTLLVHFSLTIINIMLDETGDQIEILKRLLQSFRSILIYKQEEIKLNSQCKLNRFLICS